MWARLSSQTGMKPRWLLKCRAHFFAYQINCAPSCEEGLQIRYAMIPVMKSAPSPHPTLPTQGLEIVLPSRGLLTDAAKLGNDPPRLGGSGFRFPRPTPETPEVWRSRRHDWSRGDAIGNPWESLEHFWTPLGILKIIIGTPWETHGNLYKSSGGLGAQARPRRLYANTYCAIINAVHE